MVKLVIKFLYFLRESELKFVQGIIIIHPMCILSHNIDLGTVYCAVVLLFTFMFLIYFVC